uniref:Galectin n=1 Tax=Plectus sambesii TaxID=2011161 RepID=A0A914XM39_9BILA
MGNQNSSSGGDLSFEMSGPPTPFHIPTPGGLQVGKVMFIEGQAIPHGNKDHFSVTFFSDEKGEEAAFHYDVRFWKDEQSIVMNSQHNGKWQKEERIQNTFEKNRPFRIDVQITSDAFVISHDNGLPYAFNYRSKPNAITKIAIDGNVQIKHIYYGYPSHSKPKAIEGGMQPGRQIVVKGTPLGNAERFTVDLKDASGNVALHISTRFSEGAVVRNSMSANQWAAEDRGGSFPFAKNQPFQLQILCDPNVYKIAVNGQHFADFPHRMDSGSVQSVTVLGDLSGVDVQVF